MDVKTELDLWQLRNFLDIYSDEEITVSTDLLERLQSLACDTEIEVVEILGDNNEQN